MRALNGSYISKSEVHVTKLVSNEMRYLCTRISVIYAAIKQPLAVATFFSLTGFELSLLNGS